MLNAFKLARKSTKWQAHTRREILRGYGLALLPLPILFVAIVTLWLKDIQEPRESVGLWLALNLLLQTLPGLVIAFLFARSFLETGALGVGLFSCGAVLWSSYGLVALGATMPRLFTANTVATAHNLGAFAASLCYLGGAALLQRSRLMLRARVTALLAANVLALATAALIALTAIKGWAPVFFEQGRGGSPERQIVLACAIFAILLTLLLLRRGMSANSSFAGWCALALMLVAIGYLGFMLQTTIGGALGWISRAAQYLGGAYMLVAACTAFRDAEAPFAIQAPPQEMPPHPYAVAIAAVLVAMVSHVVFLPDLVTHFGFITYYPAVVLAALYGGLRAGAVAALLVEAFVVSPLPPDFAWRQEWPALIIFAITCLLISLVAELMYKAQARLERMVEELGAAKNEAESASAELKAVFDAAPAGIWIARDPACRTVLANRRANSWLRIPEGANAATAAAEGSLPRFEILDKHGLPIPNDQLPMLRALRGEEVIDYEAELKFEDGERQSYFGNATPLRDVDGNVAGAVGAFIDITERKLAENALRESQELLAAALRAGKLGVYDFDPRTGRAKWSQETYRLWGVPEGQEVSYEIVEAGVHPSDLEAFRASVQSAFDPAGSRRHECEYRVVNRADGSIRWVFADGDVTFERGEPVRLVGTVQDITERKQREEQLRRLAAFNEAALRSLGEGVYTIDEQGLVTFMNPAAEELLGWSFAELRGKKMHDMTHHHYRDGRPFPACECAGFQVLTHGRPLRNHEDVFIRKDGAFFDVIYTIAPLHSDNGKINGLIVVFSDITARKQAEDKLREISTELARILDTAATGLTHCGRDLRYVSANAAYAKWIGLSAEQIAGKPIIDIIGQAAFDIIRPHVEKVLQGQRVEYDAELPMAGSLKPIHAVYTPDCDATGAVVGWVASITDITEQKRAQERIHLLMREVNHRSKNMLTVVQAIARQTIASTPEEFLERFGDRVQALAASQDLLVKSAWRGVALEDLVRSQLALFKDLIGSRIVLEGPALLVSASASQTLGMALHELATNAGKYGALSSREGCVKIEWGIKRANGAEATFCIKWRESGGPAVAPPKRRGFGHVIISSTPERSLDAKVDLDFAVTGLSWRLECPAKEIVERTLPAPDPAGICQLRREVAQ